MCFLTYNPKGTIYSNKCYNVTAMKFRKDTLKSELNIFSPNFIYLTLQLELEMESHNLSILLCIIPAGFFLAFNFPLTSICGISNCVEL